MKRSFVAVHDVPLRDEGFPDFAARVEATDPAQTVKGMFFADVLAVLGGVPTELERTLIAPPRAGRYLPFATYPLRDHAVLAYHAARTKFPDHSLREGLRRLHRGNVVAFSRTTVGKVMTALTTDVKAGFGQLEGAFGASRVSGTLRVKVIEERAIEVRFDRANPWLDCCELGTLEGMGVFYGKTFRTEVQLDDACSGSFVCRWRE